MFFPGNNSGVTIPSGRLSKKFTFAVRHKNGVGTPNGSFKIWVESHDVIQAVGGSDSGFRKRYTVGSPRDFKTFVN